MQFGSCGAEDIWTVDRLFVKFSLLLMRHTNPLVGIVELQKRVFLVATETINMIEYMGVHILKYSLLCTFWPKIWPPPKAYTDRFGEK